MLWWEKESFWHTFIVGVFMTAQLHAEVDIQLCLKLESALSKWGISDCLELLEKSHTFSKSIIKSVIQGPGWQKGSFFCTNWVFLLWNTWRLFVKCSPLWSHGRGASIHPSTWIFSVLKRGAEWSSTSFPQSVILSSSHTECNSGLFYCVPFKNCCSYQ